MKATSGYLNKPTRSLSQTLIDTLGPDPIVMRPHRGWTAYIASYIRTRKDGQPVKGAIRRAQIGARQVHIHTDGRIRTYNARSVLEAEYHDPR